MKEIRKVYTAWKKRIQKGASGEDDKKQRRDEQEALDILSHEAKRAKYDEALALARSKLLAKIKKHCYDAEKDVSSLTGDDYEDLDIEQLRRVYAIYDDSNTFQTVETIADNHPEKPKAHCMEENTLIQILRTHMKKNANGVSLPWQNPVSKRPFTQELANEITHRIMLRNTELISAIDVDDIEGITKAIENGAEVNSLYSQTKKTPILNYAILKQVKLETIRLLLQSGAKTSLSDINGLTTLLCVQQYPQKDQEALLVMLKEFGNNADMELVWAIKGNNVPGIRTLLGYGADINGVVEHSTMLMHAVQMSASLQMIEELIKCGALINKVSRKNSTPLLAIPMYRGNRLALLKLLLDNGANIRQKDDAGADVMFWAISVINDSTLIQNLIESGAPLRNMYAGTNNQLHSILTLAFQYQRPRNIINMIIEKEPELINVNGHFGPPILLALKMRSILLFQWCIDHGANVNIHDPTSHQTLLMATILSGIEEMTNALLSKGVEHINRADARGNTALHHAARIGNLGIIRSLLSLGANKNSKNREGNTPLHISVSYNTLNAAQLLINEEAHTLIRNTFGLMPLHLSLSYGKTAIFPALWAIYKDNVKPENYDHTLLLIACQSQKHEVVTELLDSGMNAAYIDDRTGASSLIYAITSMYDVSILRTLISRGANIHQVDKEGRNAIMYAVLADHTDAFNFLLENGANIKLRDEDGSDILHLSSGVREVSMVKKLLELGCDPNATNNDKNTPLILASDLLNAPVMKLLLEAGANPNMKNLQGHTAMTYVIEKAGDENARVCTRLLLENGVIMTEDLHAQLVDNDLLPKREQSGGKKNSKRPKK